MPSNFVTFRFRAFVLKRIIATRRRVSEFVFYTVNHQSRGIFMHSHANKARKQAERQAVFKLNPIAAACAAALLLASTNSFAQQAAATATEEEMAAKKKNEGEAVELDAVKVTGIRRSIENAIEKKKESTSIVEVISAEDIGKLPDNSIADAISRAPGLTAQRVNGRASEINIRGFAGDFSTTLLNGREQVNPGGNRGVEFDQYPSELIGGVTIYKTPDAKLVGQGLSGTVDLQTIKPLTYRERNVSLNARFEQNSLGEVNPGYSDQGNRISATYIDQFADDTFGIALGFARLDSPGQYERSNSDIGTTTISGQQVVVPTFIKVASGSTDNVRTGLMGVFEYKPNADFHSVLDIFYSKFEKDETVRGLEMGTGSASNVSVFGGRAVGATLSGVTPVFKHQAQPIEDDIFSVGWNNKLKLNEDWTAVLDLSGSSAERVNRDLELYSGAATVADAAISDNVVITIDPITGVPTFRFGLNYADPNIVRLTDSAGWGQAGYDKTFTTKDDQVALRLNLKRDFLEGAFSSVEFGVNYAERDKKYKADEYIVRLINSPISLNGSLLRSPSPFNLVGGLPILGFDVLGAFNSGIYTLTPNGIGVNSDVVKKDYSISEEVSTFFAQLNIDTELGSIPVRGNLGVQYIRADQSSTGFRLANNNASAAQLFTAGAKYNDFLPSLNLAFELPHDQVIRFAAAKTLARPRMDKMSASNNYSCSAISVLPNGQPAPPLSCIWSGGGGNPELEPTRANSYDIAYEKYFDTKAYIGLAYYFKDLKTYSYDSTNPAFDFTGYLPPTGLTPISNFGNFGQTINGTGGYVRGTELTVSLPFNMFADFLDGFGAVINASDVSSSIAGEGPGSTTPFPGLSEFNANATLYYEKNGFSTRASLRRRGDFYGQTTGFAGNLVRNYIADESIVDFQMGYNFAEGSRFEGLSLLLQVNNLTNERYAEEQLILGQFRGKTYVEYGRSVLLGVNYKF
jgi:iron complex outermembrane recepter protein